MFGSLLGTLAKFRKEETLLKDKVKLNSLFHVFFCELSLFYYFDRKKNEQKLNNV